MDISEYHQKARLANFPPNERWAKVEGIIFFQPQGGQPSLVSIGGRDHKGKVVDVLDRSAQRDVSDEFAVAASARPSLFGSVTSSRSVRAL